MALPVDMQARLARMADTIRQHGLLNLPRDWVKPLGGKLWELRITDDAYGDVGQLQKWSLAVTSGTPATGQSVGTAGKNYPSRLAVRR